MPTRHQEAVVHSEEKMTHHVVAGLLPDSYNHFFSVTPLLKMCQVTFLTGRQSVAGLQREAQTIVCTHLHTFGLFGVAS